MALVDYGTPHKVISALQYSVWADLDPEDALVEGRPVNLRANRILAVDNNVEQRIADAISAYVSQEEIIHGLVDARKERCTKNGDYVEVYLLIDCRPKIDFAPYVSWVEKHLI